MTSVIVTVCLCELQWDRFRPGYVVIENRTEHDSLSLAKR